MLWFSRHHRFISRLVRSMKNPRIAVRTRKKSISLFWGSRPVILALPLTPSWRRYPSPPGPAAGACRELSWRTVYGKTEKIRSTHEDSGRVLLSILIPRYCCQQRLNSKHHAPLCTGAQENENVTFCTAVSTQLSNPALIKGLQSWEQGNRRRHPPPFFFFFPFSLFLKCVFKFWGFSCWLKGRTKRKRKVIKWKFGI